MRKIYSLICILIFINISISCVKEKSNYNTHLLEPILIISEYPDSSLFHKIADIKFANEYIYILDSYRRDIAVMNENFNEFHSYGSGGNGPNELTMPRRMYIDSNNIFILDLGSGGIKVMKNDTVTRTISIPGANLTNFSICNHQIFISYTTDSSSIIIIPLTDSLSKGKLDYMGMLKKSKYASQTMLQNNRYLFPQEENILISVLESSPIIEMYNIKEKSLIANIEYTDIPLIKTNMEFINSQIIDDHSYYTIVEDADIQDNDLFLLVANLGKHYKVNKILRFKAKPSYSISDIYELPGNIYDKICITKENIIAFNVKSNTIEKFLIPK